MARFNLVLEDDLSDLLKAKVPRGIRSEFCRAILTMGLQAIKDHGPGFVTLAIAGEVSFKPSNCQNLEPSDEKRGSNSKD